MNIIDRLRIYFSIPPSAEIPADGYWTTFINEIQHQEGNAVEVYVVPNIFSTEQIGDMLTEDLIYFYYVPEEGGYVLYSDKDRMAKFDQVVLGYLFNNGIIQSRSNPWWAAG